MLNSKITHLRYKYPNDSIVYTMNDITFCEMREKEVINIIDGKKLGRILDIVFTCHGDVLGIIVPGEKKFFKNISGNDSLFLPWKNINKIGEDAILVSLVGGSVIDGCPNNECNI